MDGFLEANRVVELSLSKLATIKRSGDLPLRRTLLVSGVLNRAQDVATSAQESLLISSHTSPSRCSSKLVANFSHSQSNIDGLPATPRSLRPLSREESPIARPGPCPHFGSLALESDDESMDFENVNSFLGDILQEVDADNDFSQNMDQHNILEDISNKVSNWSESTEGFGSGGLARPVSPGKRNYQQAFSFMSTDGCQGFPQEEPLEDLKRFKSSTPEATSLESVPGFCSYLSSKNLQTVPFITYMFGRGFTHPSDPGSVACDWPATNTNHSILDQEMTAPTVTPILAF